MNQDQGIKLQSMSLLWELGYVVRPEVVLSERRRSTGPRTTYLDVTDVDVMGYRFDPLLAFETVSVDCGSGQKRSGMDRAFWCAGMMKATNARRVICVVGKNVEEEHRRAALKLGVVLTSIGDFSELCESIVGQNRRLDFTPYINGTDEWLEYLSNTDDRLSFYLARDNWARDWSRVPTQLPALLRRWQVNVDLSKPLHKFGLMECAVMVGISIVMMSNHMLVTRPRDLRGAVRNYVLGGQQRSAMIDSLAKRVAELDVKLGIQPLLFEESQSAVNIPNFDHLLDVTDRLTKKPRAAQHVPRYLQAIQLAQLHGDPRNYSEWLGDREDPLVSKFAIDVLDYVAKTSHTRGAIKDIFGI